MDEAARLELRSLISSTASRESGKTPVLHSSGVGKPLRQSSPSWSRRVGLAVLLLLIPIAYSVILAMMAHLHGKKQSSFGDTVLEVLSVASTLWPILFAAVLGPLLKSIALFRAERGSRLGSLEFLLTSQTTASALKNILTMGWIGSWAIGIIAMWSLSPLGGQAALRSLGLQPNPISTKTPATYYLGNNRSQVFQYYRAGASVFFGASAGASLISDMRTILSTSFSTQDILVSHANTSSPHYNKTITDLGGKWEASRSGRRDLWRNVRIPFLELLPGCESDDPHAWVSVPQDEIVPYASLIGLPIRGGSFERPGNSSMTVHFNYQTLSCGNAFNGSEWARNGSTSLWYHNTSSSVPLRYQYMGQAAPNMGYPNIWFDFPNTSTLAEHFSATFDMEPQSKLQLVMGGGCTDAAYHTTEMLRLCDISTSYIDMQIGCIRATVDADLVCQAKQARHTPSYPVKGNLTALSSWRLGPGTLRELPFTGASHHVSEPSTLEIYLRDPLGVFQRIRGGYMDDPETTNKLGCFTFLPPEIIERRLATVLNTITMSTYEVNVLTGGKGLSLDGGPVLWQNTTATWTEFDRDIYKLNKPWFITTVLSTVVLMICAVANIVVRQRIRAPDFLDSVAGLTRDSQFVDVSQEGSGESGSNRLEMIKDVKVRICDVYPEREIGKIALTTELNGPKLRWDRRYA
ncbi:uncharacterized protein FFB20_10436 [Fusarium fujikuroi]|nr:uncharacterized protein Y057_12185 [Fusarium fujikuroi]QGI84996.1 hypothetical protein CEK25_011725 [Fusarium fujikuroi]SCN97590.1 uncharacterized protein FFB20_10436 [Fusarium fujikuroi]SCO11102.1 uncharacterized protein FFC1_11380 [Fusarium fujikuroi]